MAGVTSDRHLLSVLCDSPPQSHQHWVPGVGHVCVAAEGGADCHTTASSLCLTLVHKRGTNIWRCGLSPDCPRLIKTPHPQTHTIVLCS